MARTEAFRLLGIPAGSDRQAVVNAYRRLVRTTHPDVSTDPAAAERFAALTAAYRLVSVALAPRGDPEPTVRRRARSAAAPVGDRADLGREGGRGSPLGGPWPTGMSLRDSAMPSQQAPIVAGPVRVRPLRGSPGDA